MAVNNFIVVAVVHTVVKFSRNGP